MGLLYSRILEFRYRKAHHCFYVKPEITDASCLLFGRNLGSYDEDRLHARIIAPVLSQLRNTAINLIRREGFRYIPDAWRNFASRPDRGLSLLLKP